MPRYADIIAAMSGALVSHAHTRLIRPENTLFRYAFLPYFAAKNT